MSVPTKTFFEDSLPAGCNRLGQLLVLLHKLIHVDFLVDFLVDFILAFLRLIVLFFLYRLDIFGPELLLDSPLLCLLPQLNAQVLSCLISFGLLLFLLLSIEPSLFLGLAPQSPLLVDSGTARKLVPHLPGTFHEVFILDLFQPSVA